MPKNLVVFSDGTGQEGGVGQNTNVYQLFGMIEDRTPRQIAFYDPGLGTSGNRALGLATGRGISKNIRQCYRFIFDNYEAGDQIFLFGFSRGATTVRSLSGFIDMFGILPRSRPELIKKAYRIYKIEDHKDREAVAQSFRIRHNLKHWTTIKFLGVWDTVAALGVPIKWLSGLIDKLPFWRHEFHNLQLSPAVEHAVQALAIDDERKIFHPLIWDRGVAEYQTVEQVWFCGMHTDVGGGYRECGLSDIAMEWMVQKAIAHGLLIFSKKREEWEKCLPNPDGFMHDSRKGGLSRFYRREPRSWNHREQGKPRVHESVIMRQLNQHNEGEPAYSPWILNGEYDIEPWTHPDQWANCPDGLQDWCFPIDPRLRSSRDPVSG